MKIFNDEESSFLKNRNSDPSGKLSLYNIDTENHMERTDWDRKKIHVRKNNISPSLQGGCIKSRIYIVFQKESQL